MIDDIGAPTLPQFKSLFDQIWDISTEGMRLVDISGKIIRVNPAYCRMVGMPCAELNGELFTKVYHPDSRQAILNIFLAQAAQKNFNERDYYERVLWNDRHVWYSITSIFVEIGQATYVLSLITDSTNRKRAQKALQLSEQRFRLIFNSANDAVYVNELHADHKLGKFLEANYITSQRLLYSLEEIKTLNPYAIHPAESHANLDLELANLMQTKHAIFEIEQVRKDNRRLPVEVSAHLFEYKNRKAILSIARDITERKRAEKDRHLQSTQLRDLATRLQDIREEERSMIAREIHDELGQVLTVLKIQVSLLSNKIKPIDTATTESFNDLTHLIDQSVHSVQRITAKLRPGILDELGLLAAIEWQAKDFEKNTGIQCKYSLPETDLDLGPEKTTAIFRVLQEALTNVARHSTAKRVSIFLKKQLNSLILEVTDNGRGISKSQIENPKSLGLLGMKERALVLGGTFSINGLTDQGTNVKVDIPLEIS